MMRCCFFYLAIASIPQIHCFSSIIFPSPHQKALQIHTNEYKTGVSNFGSSKGVIGEWKDSDFKSLSVGIGNAGPNELSLRRGDEVFSTTSPVLSPSECEYFIGQARKAIAEGKEEEQEGVEIQGRKDWERTNSDLGEAKVSCLSEGALDRLREILDDKLYPMLESRFGVSDLTVYDGLILGSIAPSRSQPVHRDASLLTLNVVLSDIDSYTGGGTYIEGISDTDTPLRIRQGHVISHASGVMHAGNAIQTGERWVLVLFCIARDEVRKGGERRMAGAKRQLKLSH
jgi:hypothetical protein